MLTRKLRGEGVGSCILALPAHITQLLGLKPGDYVNIEFDGNRIIIVPQSPNPRSQAKGAGNHREMIANEG